MFFFWKAPEVSWEHFSQHYAHVHSDLTVAAQSFGAFDVKRYTQVTPSFCLFLPPSLLL